MRIINVFYHTVSDLPLSHIEPLYHPKNIKQFRSDLKYLLKHYKAVSADDLLKYTKGELLIEKPSFHLSFDDGLREVYDVVLPILQEYGIPATVFVNSAFVDNKELFFRHREALAISRNEAAINEDEAEEFLKTAQPYLTIEELRTLQTKGFTIGAHSVSHPDYQKISLDEAVRQTLDSCNYVKENFGEKNIFFSFPFSEAGFASQEGLNKRFYERISGTVDLTFGISGIMQRGCHFGRIDLERSGFWCYSARMAVNRARLAARIKGKN
ncbi:MAG: polysaccharide deacetylase family protein [Bacteroidales bacterium]|jgi:peptidoglycan/xylan/chitin deacetylase (PgdA/CDA1 family)|nr:polysaccharide deacetylase family protein [Bacteroidales bacterium]